LIFAHILHFKTEHLSRERLGGSQCGNRVSNANFLIGSMVTMGLSCLVFEI